MTTIVGQTNRHPWLRLGFVAVGWIAAAAAASITQEESTMKLTSVAWMEGQPIPVKFTCDGADVSPLLTWSDAPAATRSFALISICDDPDAPAGTWGPLGHLWIAGDRDGVGRGNCHRRDAAGWREAGGERLPPHRLWRAVSAAGCAHRYYFKLYALDATPALKSRATKVELLRAMAGHILAEARLMGTYQRAR